MVSHKFVEPRDTEYVRKSINVVDLKNKAKFEEKKQKKLTLLVSLVSLMIVAFSVFILSL